MTDSSTTEHNGERLDWGQFDTNDSSIIRLGDVVTVTILRDGANETTAQDTENSNLFWLFAEGFADGNVYLEKRADITRIHQGLFRIDSPTAQTSEKSTLFSQVDPGYHPKPDQSYGKPLVYGDQYRLKHLHSNKFLSLSQDLGWTIALVTESEFGDCNCIVLPFSADKYTGDTVAYSDKFLISFPDTQVRQYLSMRKDQWGKVDIVSSSLKPACLFQFCGFERWQMGNLNAMRYGVMLQLKHSVLGAYLAGVNIADEEKREMQGKSPAATRGHVSGEPWRAVLSYLNHTYNYWVLENKCPLKGGVVEKGAFYHLRHAISEKYLCADFALRSAPDPGFLFTFVTPRRRDSIAELRLQDLIVVSSNQGSVLGPEPVTTLEQFWQNMVVSCQTSLNVNTGRFYLRMTHTLTLGDSENQMFELIGVNKTMIGFFRMVQGFRPTLTEARSALKKAGSSGRYTEHAKGFLFPRAKSLLQKLYDSLRYEPNLYQLHAYQRILMDLHIPHQLLKILRIPDVHKFQSELIDLCQASLELICRNNSQVSSEIIDTFKLMIMNILIHSPAKYEMLAEILLKVECEASLHAQLIAKICTAYQDLELDDQSVRYKTSLLRILTTLFKKTSTKSEESRDAVYEKLYLDKPVVTFNEATIGDEETQPELRTAVSDFELKLDSNADRLGFIVQTLTLLSELCVRRSDFKAEKMKVFISERVGLNWSVLQKVITNKNLMFPIRTVCVKLVGVLYFRQPAQKKMMEWPLLHGCWLYDEAFNPITQISMFRRKEDIRIEDEPIENAKFSEFLFWMNKKEPENPSPKELREFLQYMEERLLLLKRMVVQGYASDAYLAFLYHGLQDFAWAITQSNQSFHWFFKTISRAPEAETAEVLRELGKLFLKALRLAKMIYKMFIRRKLLLALYGDEPYAASMSVAEFVAYVLQRWLEINSKNDEHEEYLIGFDDFKISRNGTCKVYLEKIVDKHYDLVRTISDLLLRQSPVACYACDQLTTMLSRLQTEEVKVSSSLASIQPMETESYVKLREVIDSIQIDAEKPPIHITKTEVNKNLFLLWNTLELVRTKYPKLFRSFQKLLRKLGMSRTFSNLFNFCSKKQTYKDAPHVVKFMEDCTRLTLLLCQEFIERNPKNMKELIQLINWNHSFTSYSEFIWLMKELGLMEYIGVKNLGVLVKDALMCFEDAKADKIIEFLSLYMIDRDQDKRNKYQTAIGKVLFKMLEDVSNSKESVSQSFLRRNGELQRRIYYKQPELREIAMKMRSLTFDAKYYSSAFEISEQDIKVILTPTPFNQVFGHDAIHPSPNHFDLSSHWKLKQKELQQATALTKPVEFASHQICKLIFADGNLWAQTLRQFLGIAAEQLKQRKNTRFLLNLLEGVADTGMQKDKETLVLNVRSLRPNAKEIIITLFWEFEIVELAYTAVHRETDIYIQLTALQLLDRLHSYQVPLHRTRLVNFMKKDESAYDFFLSFQSVLAKYEIILVHAFKALGDSQPGSNDESIFCDNSLDRISSLMLKIIEFSSPDLKLHPHYKDLYRSAVSLYLRFFTHCSDVCYLEFQELMRVQSTSEGASNVNMVVFLAEFLYEFTLLHTEMLLEELEVVSGSMVALCESISGPNLENQHLVLRNEKFILGINRLLGITQMQLVDVSNDMEVPGNVISCHAATLNLLLALLEGDYMNSGNQSPKLKNPKQAMVELLDLNSMRTGLMEIYKKFIERKERLIKLETPDAGVDYRVINLAIQQCILVKKIESILKRPVLLPNPWSLPQDQIKSVQFYEDFIGYVEIQRDETIIDLLFQIPYKSKFITQMTADSLIIEAKRTSQKDKVDSFVRRVGVCRDEMMHQMSISRYQVKALSKHWKMFSTLSFVLVCAINLILLIFVTGYTNNQFTLEPWIEEMIVILGTTQSVLKATSIASYVFEYWPTIRTVLEQPPWFYLLPSYSTRRTFFVYSYVYILLSITGVFYFQVYPLLLLDVLYQAERLTTILKAVTLNAKQLLLTAAFAVLMVYIFSTYSLMYFQNYYNNDTSMFCNNLQTCFATTLNHGIRIGGGIGEVMKSPEEQDYYTRMVFDLLFFIIIIIILLNILFGIIIDTFGELRDKKRDLEEDMNNVCFICGENRSLIDVKGEGWSEHTQKRHNPANYFAFLVHISDIPKQDCSGIEKYVKDLHEKYDTRYIPSTSKAIKLRS